MLRRTKSLYLLCQCLFHIGGDGQFLFLGTTVAHRIWKHRLVLLHVGWWSSKGYSEECWRSVSKDRAVFDGYGFYHLHWKAILERELNSLRHSLNNFYQFSSPLPFQLFTVLKVHASIQTWSTYKSSQLCTFISRWQISSYQNKSHLLFINIKKKYRSWLVVIWPFGVCVTL